MSKDNNGSYPKRAIILAAGYGTRLDPLTRQVPKALVPLWNRPMLEHSIDLLYAWGVRSILVNLHSHADQVFDFCRAFHRRDLHIELSYEPTILGTGGALRRAAWFIGDQPFWMLNADVAADLDPAPLVRLAQRQKALAALWLTDQSGPRTVERSNHQITNYRSRRPGTPGTFTFCGLQWLSPRILEYIPRDESFSSIIAAYERAAKAKERIVGDTIPGSFWADIGTPEQYREAHRQIERAYRSRQPGARFFDPKAPARNRTARKNGVHLEGCVCLNNRTLVAPGAQITDSVCWANSQVTRRAAVTRAIVANDTTVRHEASWLSVPASLMLTEPEQTTLAALGIPLDNLAAHLLPPRGSDRSFIRLEAPQTAPGTWILVRYQVNRRENRHYARHTRFLAEQGIPVPGLLAHNARQQFMVIQDLGNKNWTDLLAPASTATRLRHYRRLVPIVHRLHAAGPACQQHHIPLARRFGPQLYQWEHDLFFNQFIFPRCSPAPALLQQARKELRQASTRLNRLPNVLLHRDLQSSNILQYHNRPYLIDYQGMRLGPAVYDLASLLCDPYLEPEPGIQARVLADYDALSAPEHCIEEAFPYAVLQRLGQALGAYGRLSQLPGGQLFQAAIPRACRLLQQALVHLANKPALQELLKAVDTSR